MIVPMYDAVKFNPPSLLPLKSHSGKTSDIAIALKE
jgi:hypothetical protein